MATFTATQLTCQDHPYGIRMLQRLVDNLTNLKDVLALRHVGADHSSASPGLWDVGFGRHDDPAIPRAVGQIIVTDDAFHPLRQPDGYAVFPSAASLDVISYVRRLGQGQYFVRLKGIGRYSRCWAEACASLDGAELPVPFSIRKAVARVWPDDVSLFTHTGLGVYVYVYDTPYGSGFTTTPVDGSFSLMVFSE